MRSFQPVFSCQNSLLATYQAKIRRQNQFLTLIKAELVAPLAAHLQHCVISGRKCLLYTDAEEWAIQLRLCETTILAAINQSNLANVHTLQVRLVSQPTAPINREINLPSKKNIQLLRENLQNLEDDPLQQALLRLSNTLNSKINPEK